MHRTHRLSWDGAVDADGHILEPSDLWETYLGCVTKTDVWTAS
jgi:hypothetical protein